MSGPEWLAGSGGSRVKVGRRGPDKDGRRKVSRLQGRRSVAGDGTLIDWAPCSVESVGRKDQGEG